MKVYKYRGVNFFDRDIKTLKECHIYASTFDKLNDPFEGIFNDQISTIIYMIEKIFKISGADVIERLKKITNYKSSLGIYSLSKTSKNELLWAHYANSHTGFCIEYNLQGLIENYLISLTVNKLEVEYKKSPQTITVKDFDDKILFLRKLFATKSKEWKYEDEIRLIFDEFGYKSYHSSTLTGIYFGINMEEKNKEILKESLSNLDVKFYQIYRKQNSYELDYKLVYENTRVLTKNIFKFNFSILEHEERRLIENFYIWFKDSEFTQTLLEEFCDAFREKYAKKEKANLFIFRDNSVIPIIQKYPLTISEEKKYNESLIAHSYTSDEGYSMFFYG